MNGMSKELMLCVVWMLLSDHIFVVLTLLVYNMSSSLKEREEEDDDEELLLVGDGCAWVLPGGLEDEVLLRDMVSEMLRLSTTGWGGLLEGIVLVVEL